MMGPYFQQPRKKINQKAQGKKKLAGEGHMYPPRHLVVNTPRMKLFGNNPRDLESGSLRDLETSCHKSTAYCHNLNHTTSANFRAARKRNLVLNMPTKLLVVNNACMGP